MKPRVSSTKRTPKHRTIEHPPGSGIKITELPNKTGGQVFGVSYRVIIPAKLLGVPNKREMRQEGTLADAKALAEDRLVALKAHGTTFASIPADAQRALAIAWSILEAHNKQAGSGLNVVDTIKAGIRTLDPVGGRRTLSEVFAELRASKAERLSAGTLDASTERDYRGRSKALEAHLGDKYVSDITAEDITRTLRKLASGRAQRTLKNYRNVLSESLSHAKTKRYCTENPMQFLTREELKALGGQHAGTNLDGINILTVPEAARLLKAAQEHGEAGMLATVVLRLFCGFRTKEVSKLDWSEVHWLDPKPYVHLPMGKAKKRRIRQVEIPSNALAWLKLCNPSAHGPVDPFSSKTYCKRFGRIAKKASIGSYDSVGDWESEWESNDTRHSFASYHFALHGNALETARLLGHKQNDEVLFAHHRQLARPEDAAAFFALLPEAEAEKVTQFPQAATA